MGCRLPCQKAVASVAAAVGPKKPGGVAIFTLIGWEVREVQEVNLPHKRHSKLPHKSADRPKKAQRNPP
eukprot:9335505-Alexandrium_andersonii.AAC.1